MMRVKHATRMLQKWALLWFLTPLLLSPAACLFHPLTGGEEIVGSDSEDTVLPLLILLSLIANPSSSDSSEAPTMITMYNAGTTDGAMGGISGADASCDASSNKPVGQTGIAFLSTSTQDLISRPGVPSGIPVQGPGGVVIGTDWNDLFGSGQTILNNLFTAAVLPFASSEFYSGTDPDGFYELNANCNDWVANTGSAAHGIGNLVSDDWLSWNDPAGACTGPRYLVCVSW